ncbi:hypothetical protein B0H14DRAFT_2870147, partial [Mycena olivaceomarginata]
MHACALNLERDGIHHAHAATAAPRTLGSSRPQRTSTLHVRYALLMDHPKEGKTSDAQPQLHLRLDEVLPRRANPQPQTPKKKEPHSPILGVVSSPPDGRSHPRRLSVVSRLRRRIGPLLRAKKIKIRQCRGVDSHRQAHAWGHPRSHLFHRSHAI